MEKARAEKWMNFADEAMVCWAKMAQRDHATAIDAGKSPTGDANAYVAAVP